MSVWLLAALILTGALVPCVGVIAWGSFGDGLAALEIAGTLGCTALMVLSQLYSRQPFLDLAIVLAVLGNLGALVFARLLEGEL